MDTNRIFGWWYNRFTLFKVKENRITLIEKFNTGGHGNLFEVRDEIMKRGDYEFNVITHGDYELRPGNILGLVKLFTKKCYLLATSSYVFLNDNFMPIAYMDIPEETRIIQLWHGMGSFKKFGASSEKDKEVLEELKLLNSKVDLVCVSAEGIKEAYSDALMIPKDRIRALGNPQGDYYFREHDKDALRRKLAEKYPTLNGKKLALYAPTFRGEPERDADIINHFDFDRFKKEFSAEYEIAVRLHPQIKSAALPEGIVDLSNYEDVRELLIMTDILITDYSSILVEYSMLDKPVVLYAYDKDWYLSSDRGFYHDFMKTAPGPVVSDMDELINAIRQEADHAAIRNFAKLHNDSFDSFSAKRIVDYVMYGYRYTHSVTGKEGRNMKIIVGLGNPTDRYKGTRHNAGFMAIDAVAKTYNIRIDQCKHRALVGSGFIEGQRVLLMKPLTYMNNSGEAVASAVSFYKVDPCDVLIIYDDISLDPGMMRIRKKGSAGGHNGMKSIINHLGTTEFPRMRVGIGEAEHPDHELVDYVLGHFSAAELESLGKVFDIVPKAAALFVNDEIDEAMNRYNTGRKQRAAKEKNTENETD